MFEGPLGNRSLWFDRLTTNGRQARQERETGSTRKDGGLTTNGIRARHEQKENESEDKNKPGVEEIRLSRAEIAIAT